MSDWSSYCCSSDLAVGTTDAKAMAVETGVPLHKCAVKFYTEKGVILRHGASARRGRRLPSPPAHREALIWRPGMLGWTRTARGLITVVGLTMTLYHLYTAWFGAPDALSFRAVHVAFALVLAFLIVPGRGGETDDPGVLQLILAGLSVIACGYLLWAQEDRKSTRLNSSH